MHSTKQLQSEIQTLLSRCNSYLTNCKQSIFHLSNSPVCASIHHLLNQLTQILSGKEQLRLKWLIEQQILEEDLKVRRERLIEYQEKIVSQRRLIFDKEIFLEMLFRPKKKRPPNLSTEEFQEYKIKEIEMLTERNKRKLEEESEQMKDICTMVENENKFIQKLINQAQTQKSQPQTGNPIQGTEVSQKQQQTIQKKDVSLCLALPLPTLLPKATLKGKSVSVVQLMAGLQSYRQHRLNIDSYISDYALEADSVRLQMQQAKKLVEQYRKLNERFNNPKQVHNFRMKSTRPLPKQARKKMVDENRPKSR